MHPCWNHWCCYNEKYTQSCLTLSCTKIHIMKYRNVFPGIPPSCYKTWVQFTSLNDFFWMSVLLPLGFSPRRDNSFLWQQTQRLNFQPLALKARLSTASEIRNTEEELHSSLMVRQLNRILACIKKNKNQ